MPLVHMASRGVTWRVPCAHDTPLDFMTRPVTLECAMTKGREGCYWFGAPPVYVDERQ
jgi:hypothetical protein